MRDPSSERDPWGRASWEGAEEEALLAGDRLSLPDRLEWLERSSRIARELARDAVRSRGFDVVELGPRPSSSTDLREAADSLSLLQLLGRSGGVDLVERWEEPTVVAALLALPTGRRLIVVERTYREGIRVLVDPTAADLATGRELRLWDLWNDERAALLAGAI